MSKSNKANAPTVEAPAVTEAAATDVVDVVFALNKVVYGNREVAPPKTLFRPTSVDERNFLLGVGAVREPTDSERVIAGLVAPTAETETESSIG